MQKPPEGRTDALQRRIIGYPRKVCKDYVLRAE